ncbi:DUF397 domain-containing protein [Nocardiopsis mwathae]|uniref:DUF397 domain-containing protein n=1 Tax=Nocardiopsis mwathae TaxID=1472723 RepID=UPI0031B587CD
MDQALAADGASTRAWPRAVRRSTSPAWHERVTELESKARSIAMAAPMLVPGLLQVPDYARHIFKQGRPGESAEVIEGLVRVRTERLTELTRDDPPILSIVAYESAIRRPVGGPAVHQAQVRHLVDLAEGGPITIGIISDGSRCAALSSGSFRFLELRDQGTVLRVDHSAGSPVIDAEVEVRRHEALFRSALVGADTPEKSVEMLRTMIEGDREKSSYSGAQFECVEVRGALNNVDVRDSKDPSLGHLAFTGNEWCAVLTDVKAGRL